MMKFIELEKIIKEKYPRCEVINYATAGDYYRNPNFNYIGVNYSGTEYENFTILSGDTVHILNMLGIPSIWENEYRITEELYMRTMDEAIDISHAIAKEKNNTPNMDKLCEQRRNIILELRKIREKYIRESEKLKIKFIKIGDH